jgi:regulator of cell morphogenesis and NO signaling
MITDKTTLAEIGHAQRSWKELIDRYDLEEGDRQVSLKHFCLQHKLSPDFVVALLNAFEENVPFEKSHFECFESPVIIDYLQKTHKYYLGKLLPELEQNFYFLVKHFAAHQPYLIQLSSLFIKFRNELTKHIMEEEDRFFPYIKYLEAENTYDYTCFNYYRVERILSSYSAKEFLEKHDEVEATLARVRELVIQHTPAEKISMSYNIFLTQLDLFEQELMRHAVLEEELVMPRALETEEELRQKLMKYRNKILSTINHV